MKKNVFAICLMVSVVALFVSCNYRYNKDKMQEDLNQALEEGDDEKAAQLSTRIEELTETEIDAMTMVNEVVESFSYKLNIDRMINDLEQAAKDGNEEQKQYLLDRLTKLYRDPDGPMNDEQMERLEDYIGVGHQANTDEEEEFDYSDFE